jgi:hypothetical protein
MGSDGVPRLLRIRSAYQPINAATGHHITEGREGRWARDQSHVDYIRFWLTGQGPVPSQPSTP